MMQSLVPSTNQLDDNFYFVEYLFFTSAKLHFCDMRFSCVIEVASLNFIYVEHNYMRHIIFTFLCHIHEICAAEFSNNSKFQKK
jgi:hypothetical protein